MRAAQQGRFDALCGVYAIINALDVAGLVLPRSRVHQEMFTRLAVNLPEDRLKSAMQYGLEATDLMRSARRTFRWLRAEHGLDLHLSQPYRDAEFELCATYLEIVRLLSEQPNTAVIVSVAMPGVSHWTVVKSIRGATMIVRDSGRLTELPLSKFALTRSHYRFTPSDTLVLRLRRPRHSHRS